MIEITESAAAKIKNMLARRGKGQGIRIGVRTTGCSGLAYVLEYVDNSDNDVDETFEQHDIKIFIDKRSLVYLKGTAINWAKHGLNEGFEFINPNEKDRCGCGESFRI